LVRFEPQRVLLGTAEGRCLALHRGSRGLRPVKCNTRKLFRYAERPLPPDGLIPEDRSGVVFLDSEGTRWTAASSYCSEGAHRTGLLWRKRQPFPTAIDPCNSVSAVEVHGGRVFLGTCHPGELGTYQGEGLVVQDAETGEVLGRLAEKDGLSGDLIAQIRVDPLTDTLWVFSQWGYNRIDDELRILESGYFQLDFDPRTGASRVVVIDHHEPINLLVALAERIDFKDRPGFARAARAIPRPAREVIKPWHLECASGGLCMPGERDFLPDDVLPLLPFFLEAAHRELLGSGTSAIDSLCAFHDHRVEDLMHQLYGNARSEAEWHIARHCIEKYNRKKEQDGDGWR